MQILFNIARNSSVVWAIVLNITLKHENLQNHKLEHQEKQENGPSTPWEIIVCHLRNYCIHLYLRRRMDKLIHSVFLLPKVFVPFTSLPFVLRTKGKRCGEVFPRVLLVTEWMHPRGTSTKAQDRAPLTWV